MYRPLSLDLKTNEGGRANYLEKIKAITSRLLGSHRERKSELCAQTRASSLAGGMPVW